MCYFSQEEGDGEDFVERSGGSSSFLASSAIARKFTVINYAIHCCITGIYLLTILDYIIRNGLLVPSRYRKYLISSGLCTCKLFYVLNQNNSICIIFLRRLDNDKQNTNQ
jgi:hypothetical protein